MHALHLYQLQDRKARGTYLSAAPRCQEAPPPTSCETKALRIFSPPAARDVPKPSLTSTNALQSPAASQDAHVDFARGAFKDCGDDAHTHAQSCPAKPKGVRRYLCQPTLVHLRASLRRSEHGSRGSWTRSSRHWIARCGIH